MSWTSILFAPKDKPIIVRFDNGKSAVCTWRDDGLGGAWHCGCGTCLGNWEAIEWKKYE